LETREIPMSSITLGGNHTRKSVDTINIAELMGSMKQQGLIHPITVKKKGRKYQVVAGFSRYAAAERLGWKKMAVTVRKTLRGKEDQADSILVNFNENANRVNPSFYELSQALRTLVEDHKLTPEELSVRTGFSRIRINQLLTLMKNNVPLKYQKMIKNVPGGVSKGRKGIISYSNAIAIKNAQKHGVKGKQATRLWELAASGSGRHVVKKAIQDAAKGRQITNAPTVSHIYVPLVFSTKDIKRFELEQGTDIRTYCKTKLKRDKNLKGIIL